MRVVCDLIISAHKFKVSLDERVTRSQLTSVFSGEPGGSGTVILEMNPSLGPRWRFES